MDWLQQVFGTEHMVTWWQECARAVLIFAFGLLLVRLLGRRVFAKWGAVDIVVAIVVGSNLSRALTGSAPLWGTLAACVLLMALHWAFARAAALWPAFSSVVEGDPIELVNAGVTHADRLRANGVSRVDLDEALRNASLDAPGKAAKVTLEPSGRITVVKRAEHEQSGSQYS
jgi:uncharacterized membrane protein YcaP (DUF421 family)